MVLRHRDFALHWSGQIVSQMGSQFNSVALAWLMLQRTGSGWAMGAVFFAQMLPNALFGWMAGVLVDRADRRRLMIMCDWIRAVIVVSLPIAWTSGNLPDMLVYAATFGVSTLSLLFYAAEKAVIPQLVPEAEWTDANAFAEITGQLAGLLGPVLAGVLLAVLSTPVDVLYFDAASFVVSAFCISAMRWRDGVRPPVRSLGEVMEDVREGFAYLRGNRFLMSILLIFAAANFVMTPLCVIFPVLSNNVLQTGAIGYGWLISGFGVGMLLGSLAAGSVSRRLRAATVINLGIGLLGCALAAMSLGGSLPVEVGLIALGGICVAPANAVLLTMVQRTAPERMQGRVFALVGTVAGAAAPAGVAVATPLVETLGARGALSAIGIGTMLTALVGWLVLAPQDPQRDHDDQRPAQRD